MFSVKADQRQTLLFSATFNDEVKAVADRFLQSGYTVRLSIPSNCVLQLIIVL